MKVKDLDEGLWSGIKDIANTAKAGYAAGRASSQGARAAKGAYDAVRNNPEEKSKKKEKPTSTPPAKKEKPAPKQPTNQTFNTFAKLPNGASFVSPKGDTYVWNQKQQKWIGNQDVDPKQGLALFNRSKQKFIPQ